MGHTGEGEFRGVQGSSEEFRGAQRSCSDCFNGAVKEFLKKCWFWLQQCKEVVLKCELLKPENSSEQRSNMSPNTEAAAHFKVCC